MKVKMNVAAGALKLKSLEEGETEFWISDGNGRVDIEVAEC